VAGLQAALSAMRPPVQARRARLSAASFAQPVGKTGRKVAGPVVGCMHTRIVTIAAAMLSPSSLLHKNIMTCKGRTRAIACQGRRNGAQLARQFHH
jgi:hypothetical protein